MKAEELMIGDLVYYCYANPFVTKVIDVCSHGEEHFIRCKLDEKDKDNLYKQDQLEDFHVGILIPIPLTKEILEKNGFKIGGYAVLEIDTNTHLEYYLPEHRLRKVWCGIDELDNHAEKTEITFQCHCFYVHELQHALKMCGIEKEIVL